MTGRRIVAYAVYGDMINLKSPNMEFLLWKEIFFLLKHLHTIFYSRTLRSKVPKLFCLVDHVPFFAVIPCLSTLNCFSIYFKCVFDSWWKNKFLLCFIHLSNRISCLLWHVLSTPWVILYNILKEIVFSFNNFFNLIFSIYIYILIK